MTVGYKRGPQRRTRQRLEMIRQLRRDGIADYDVLAYRLGVHRRTIERYMHLVNGPQRDGYAEFSPLILAHLRRYPNARLSALDVWRAIGCPGGSSRAVVTVLRRMTREGLLDAVVEPRDTSSPTTIVTRWQLPEQQAEAG